MNAILKIALVLARELLELVVDAHNSNGLSEEEQKAELERIISQAQARVKKMNENLAANDAEVDRVLNEASKKGQKPE